MKGHRLADEVHSISEIPGSPKDATEVVICYLALEAVRGSYEALTACNALKEWAGAQAGRLEGCASATQTPTKT